jgi:site-specific DNA-methyltransferase (cytosine-N4-specific)
MQTTNQNRSRTVRASNAIQGDLFAPVLEAYMGATSLSNNQLYKHLVDAGHLTRAEIEAREPVGKAAAPHCLAKRRIRWWQVEMKALGIIERVPEQRGQWRIAAGMPVDSNEATLTPALPGVMHLGTSTDLGLAIWGSCLDVFGRLEERIAACITSPPYPLRKPRAYGGVTASEWVDWICLHLEPIVQRLVPGGSIAINISNDVFDPGLPSRSLYRERFVIAMLERFGLHKMDEIIWQNSSKAPGPYQWASRNRMQLNTGYEPVYVFCNDPLKSLASNQRVLQPHTKQHLRLIQGGGEKRKRVNSDGAYRIREGSFHQETAGRIPKNVLQFGHAQGDQRRLQALAREQGLPVHGASMPLDLAIFLVQYLSRPGDLVVDPFGGTLTTAKACEMLDRLWVTSEIMAEYVHLGGYRFHDTD